MRVEVLVDVKTTPGEGPIWDVPRKIGSMCPRRAGRAIVSLERGFHALALTMTTRRPATFRIRAPSPRPARDALRRVTLRPAMVHIDEPPPSGGR